MARCFLTLWCVWFLTAPVGGAQQGARSDLRIQILEGNGAVNNIKLRQAKAPVVEVRDGSGRPLPGAAVVFQVPRYGPSARFPEDALSLTTTTDARGRAVGRGLRPNGSPGRFVIRVTASYQGDSRGAEIVEVNAQPAAQRHVSSKMIALLAIIGGAAAGGAVLAMHGGNGSTANSAASPGAGAVTISPGTPSMGPPQ